MICLSDLHIFDYQFCNLYCVGCCALADLVAAAPYIQAAIIGKILTDTSDKYQVLVGGIQRHRILLGIQIVYQLGAGLLRSLLLPVPE